MISRYSRLQERRKTRSAFLLFLGTILLLAILIFLGIPILSRFAVFVSELKGSSSPIAQEDKTPPAPPSIYPLPQFTKEQKATLTGRSEAGSTFILSNNEKTVKEILIDETSSFELDIALIPGENRIRGIAIDRAGNKSETSSPLVLIYDIEPPAVEVSSPQDRASFFADEKTINVQGKTEAEAQAMVNDRVAIVNSGGEFSQKITLEEGENIIVVVATDQAENKTEKTLKVTYSP